MRFATPVIFAVAAIAVGVSNAGSEGRYWYLPFERVFPSTAGDLPLQGQLTVGLFLILAIFTLVRALREAPAEG
jgi:hypothetical protein